jgi:predicted alpha/beta-fold hydrolase
VPSHILLSLDDPIIPASDLQHVARSPHLQVAAIPHGGHCGFMESFTTESWADRQVARYMGLL